MTAVSGLDRTQSLATVVSWLHGFMSFGPACAIYACFTQGTVARPGGYVVNLLHYEDAAALAAAVSP